MKKNLFFLPIALAFLVMETSCSKSSDGTKIQEKKASEFLATISTHKYRLTDFYSDQPIDYIESDNVTKKETDLKPYIKAHLVDDENLFDPAGTVKIYQNAVKFPGDNSVIITRNYHAGFDANNVFFDFVDYNYIPVTYKVANFTANSFSIYLNWHTGAKIYSVFTRLD